MRSIMEINREVNQILLGSLFGDGTLTKNRGKNINPRFRERHSQAQKEYLLWKKEKLAKFLKMKMYETKTDITIYSKAYSELNYYHKLFYPKGHGYKTFPIELLNKLDPLGLAVWYMDDGSFNKRSFSACLCFNEGNEDSVKSFFKNCLNIEGKIYISKRNTGTSVRIIFNKKETVKFFKLIRKFIHPQMIYKVKRTIKEHKDAKNYLKLYLRQWRINKSFKEAREY